MNVRETLSQPHRKWTAAAPASETEIAQLVSRARVELPDECLGFLQFGNGGEGPLALPPLWFLLYSVKDCMEVCQSSWVVEFFPDFVFFGSNGGLESLAFNLRVEPPWSIVMIDQIAGPDSAQEIAPDMAAFIEAIGVELSRSFATKCRILSLCI